MSPRIRATPALQKQNTPEENQLWKLWIRSCCRAQQGGPALPRLFGSSRSITGHTLKSMVLSI